MTIALILVAAYVVVLLLIGRLPTEALQIGLVFAWAVLAGALLWSIAGAVWRLVS